MKKHYLSCVIFIFSIFFGITVNASKLDLDQYKGKVVLLDFWASWCSPCKESFPWMNKMHNELSDKGLVIIAVNLDEEKKQADTFLKSVPANFKIIFDQEAELAEKFQVKGMPSSYLFDKSGELVKTHIGFKNNDADTIRQQIESYLN